MPMTKFPIPSQDFPTLPFTTQGGALTPPAMNGYVWSEAELTDEILLEISKRRTAALARALRSGCKNGSN